MSFRDHCASLYPAVCSSLASVAPCIQRHLFRLGLYPDLVCLCCLCHLQLASSVLFLILLITGKTMHGVFMRGLWVLMNSFTLAFDLATALSATTRTSPLKGEMSAIAYSLANMAILFSGVFRWRTGVLLVVLCFIVSPGMLWAVKGQPAQSLRTPTQTHSPCSALLRSSLVHTDNPWVISSLRWLWRDSKPLGPMGSRESDS